MNLLIFLLLGGTSSTLRTFLGGTSQKNHPVLCAYSNVIEQPTHQSIYFLIVALDEDEMVELYQTDWEPPHHHSLHIFCCRPSLPSLTPNNFVGPLWLVLTWIV